MTTKKTKKMSETKVVSPDKTNGKGSTQFTLGDSKSEALYDSTVSGSNYRLKYGDPINIYALVHPDFLMVQEHWIKIGEDNYRLVCPVHLTNDPAKIGSRWGYPEGCKLCALKQTLYEEAPKDSKDAMDRKKRSVAYEISAKPAYYIFATQGEGDTKRIRGKKIISPYFESDVVRKLILSKDAFTQFRNAFREQGFNSEDVPGLPVNFVGGKNAGGREQIQKVEFYKEFRLKKVPDASKDFGGIDKVNLSQIDEVYEKLQIELPSLLSGIKRNIPGKSSRKKK